LLNHDPFVSVDRDGVGHLIRIAVEKGKKVKPNIHLGVCGEHGGDPASINFFNTLGLDYVSCSPYRVPTAILAAAQAVIQEDS
jgi:pyruvate, orthophosphate dikinase